MRPILVRLALVVSIVAGLNGCTSAVRIDLAGSPFQPMEQPEGGIAIRVTDRLAAWEDAMVFSGTEVRFQTGKVYKDYFELTEGEPVTMDLVESTFSREERLLNGSEDQLWINTIVTYAATVAVNVNGRRHLLNASAASEPQSHFNTAAREAMIKVLDELARLTGEIVAKEIPTPPRRPDGAIGAGMHH